MKYLFFSLSLVHFAFGQPLPAFPDQTGEWSQLYMMDPGAVPPGPTITLLYHVYPSAVSDTLSDLYKNNDLIGSIYTDADRVWVQLLSGETGVDPGFGVGEWGLLYDFSLESGDTAYFDLYSELPAIVDTVIVHNDAGFDQRWLYLSNDDLIIEKMGSVQGLFRPYMDLFESGSQLCWFTGCFDVPGNPCAGWDASPGACANGTNGLAETVSALQVFPNPVTDQLVLRSGSLPASCAILSVTGETVRTYVSAAIEDRVLDVSGLAPGVYVLRAGEAALYFIKE